MTPTPSDPSDESTIHLTRARLDTPPVALARLESLLAPDELARADRFRFEHLRRRHIVSWGLLRLILARVTGIAPEALRFTHNEKGKPRLADPGPSFNLSHSGPYLLVGWAREGRVGVDLEVERALSDLEALAERTFAPEESSALLALPPEERVSAFFRIWTRKEAFVKAVGGGLTVPLKSFAVRLTPKEGNTLIRLDAKWTRHGDPDRSGWWVASPPDPMGDEEPLAMAVAWDRGPARIRWVDWEEVSRSS